MTGGVFVIDGFPDVRNLLVQVVARGDVVRLILWSLCPWWCLGGGVRRGVLGFLKILRTHGFVGDGESDFFAN